MLIAWFHAFQFATWGWKTEMKLAAIGVLALVGLILYKRREIAAEIEDVFNGVPSNGGSEEQGGFSPQRNQRSSDRASLLALPNEADKPKVKYRPALPIQNFIRLPK
jgi:hypothetical protein